MDVVTRHIRNLPRSTILNAKSKNGECLWLEVGCPSAFPSVASSNGLERSSIRELSSAPHCKSPTLPA